MYTSHLLLYNNDDYDADDDKPIILLFLFCYTMYILEEGHNISDIRDLEFTMANNLKNLVSRATTLDKRDINLIKLIICSALYPQLAIGDEHNPYRKSNEIIFHSPGKKARVESSQT